MTTETKDDDGKIKVTALVQHLNSEGSHVEGDHYSILKSDGDKLIAKGTVAVGHLSKKDLDALKAEAFNAAEAKAKGAAPENKARTGAPSTKAD